MAIAIVPFDAGLGADIQGLDPSAELSATDAALLRQAWFDHLVLRLREQPITDNQHMSFSRIFGEIELTPAGVLARDYGVDNGGGRAGSLPPQITVVSNVVEDGEVIGDLGDGELEWHTDASFLESPPNGSALRALEIPPTGGETSFINMYSAFEGLPAPLKRKALDISLLHSRLKSSDGVARRGFENFAITDPSQVPGAVHPAVRIHPDSGKKVLYLASPRRLCHGHEPFGVQDLARRNLGPCGSRTIYLASGLASRRSSHLGQSLHHASSQCV